MVDQDLSRLYPEHGSYFQTPGCQGMLRRILLLWCLRHSEFGYRQGKLHKGDQSFIAAVSHFSYSVVQYFETSVMRIFALKNHIRLNSRCLET